MIEEKYMRRALQLAALGKAEVAPNPMVGCVIVKDSKILSEGFHRRYGEAHAEIDAINRLESPEQIRGADVYVTLEPCSHYGKTPPCADKLVELMPKRVMIANTDPNPLVNGKGIARLRQAGIEVITGICEAEGKTLNARFFEYMTQKKPYVILKWAQSGDGWIAKENYQKVQLSNEHVTRYVHKWRAEEQAIMVGANTALYDNPHLTVRHWIGKNPTRILFDPHLKVPSSHHIFNDEAPTFCYYFQQTKVVQQYPSGVVLKQVNSQRWLDDILDDLYTNQIISVLVEGGSKLLSEFIAQQKWNEIRLIQSPHWLGKGIAAPKFIAELLIQFSVDDNIIYIFRPKA
ncbi:MAG: bifunctional diaminohydroxyphosphoribosylaminopyrimidine deaminase/5-amino-6-(5-phosphoribosylamino)uracil reductase RibD [Cytophagales bacterium]|nr:bifunctional diaminohydroxyphosphoribosylaminopyrimidine deaminase/5-amino-6-(5-phosphoribosylamino)uracil reductase RibD [Cytophagales bacterium]MDW8385086.1 bifunctional diaminohydroxyphosphoribosylaminopyrimidine deaminase/5-amino-6-(5-phosphoribosylamino)uracil reductase RibD [Flammeovirgaceae bacterium]